MYEDPGSPYGGIVEGKDAARLARAVGESYKCKPQISVAWWVRAKKVQASCHLNSGGEKTAAAQLIWVMGFRLRFPPCWGGVEIIDVLLSLKCASIKHHNGGGRKREEILP